MYFRTFSIRYIDTIFFFEYHANILTYNTNKFINSYCFSKKTNNRANIKILILLLLLISFEGVIDITC